MGDLAFPVYNNKETVNQYMRRVQQYTIKLQEDKYNTILGFINAWLNQKYESLVEFKNISESTLLTDTKKNRDVVRQYSKQLQEKFNTDLTVDMGTDSDEINDKYIIYLTMKLLNLMNYTLMRRDINGKTLYTIRKKSLH